MVTAAPDTSVAVNPIDAGEEAAEVPATAGLLELPRGVAMLVVTRGSDEGVRFVLENSLTRAGRHPENDIFLDDVTVSRRHAEFYRHGGQFAVRDVGSLNGTYVNRDRIEEVALSGGDEVQIGKFRLVYFSSNPEAGR